LSVLPSAPSCVCAALEMPMSSLRNNVSCPLRSLEQWSTAVDRTGVEWDYMLETNKESSSDGELVNCPLTHLPSWKYRIQMSLKWHQRRHWHGWQLIRGTQELELLVAYSSFGVLRQHCKHHHLPRHQPATYFGLNMTVRISRSTYPIICCIEYSCFDCWSTN
jgi:hypothetical protein